MTHPDILKMERDGFAGEGHYPQILGECEACGGLITDEYEYFEAQDGLFCSRECADDYYGIRLVN